MASASFVLLLICILQGSFGICFKEYQPLPWEVFWVLLSFIGVLCILHIWCMVEVPHHSSYITATPVPTPIVGVPSDFFWGISSIWYSKAIDMISVSPVTGTNLGLPNLLGGFVFMIILGTYPPARVLVVLLLRQLISLDGVIVLSEAGLMKNGNNEGTRTVKKKGTPSLFITGFIMALVSGAGLATINIGAAAVNHSVALAVREGANLTSASLLSWVMIFAGGFLANFVYATSGLIKNKTYTDYAKPGCARAYFKAVLTSIVWLSALVIYSKAIVLLGILGPVVGQVAFNGLAFIVANAWGLLDEEWKGFEKAKRVAIYGNAVITAVLVVVGISSGL